MYKYNKKVQLVRFLSDKVEYTISAAGLFLGKDLGGDRLFWLCNEVGICRFWSCDPFWRPLALWDPFRRRGLPPSQRRPRISSLCAAYFAQWPKNSQNNLMLQFLVENIVGLLLWGPHLSILIMRPFLKAIGLVGSLSTTRPSSVTVAASDQQPLHGLFCTVAERVPRKSDPAVNIYVIMDTLGNFVLLFWFVFWEIL